MQIARLGVDIGQVEHRGGDAGQQENESRKKGKSGCHFPSELRCSGVPMSEETWMYALHRLIMADIADGYSSPFSQLFSSLYPRIKNSDCADPLR